ncbi:MAG: Crp/Fnr family transcriptional regulator, partial [Sideroxyarcus sp.]|nr:Crp/Fnr family transcriptional regulator [Sideroxyarcus sp.]
MLADHLDIATNSSVLSHLSDKTRAGLLSRSRVMHYSRGATIFIEGDRASTMKVVLRGWVKLYRITAGGNEVIVQLLPTGRSFEEFASLYCAPYSISAQAVSDCTLLHVDVNSGQAQGDVQSEITMAVLLATSNHMDDLLCEVEQLKAQNGAQRLTEFLLKLCQNADGACEVELPYEKIVIAGRLGMKPESLSRAIGR